MNIHATALSAAALLLARTTVGFTDDALPPSSAPPADKFVCRYQEVIGSHMRTKICRTQAQIKAAEEEKQRAMDEARARGNQRNASGG